MHRLVYGCDDKVLLWWLIGCVQWVDVHYGRVLLVAEQGRGVVDAGFHDEVLALHDVWRVAKSVSPSCRLNTYVTAS